MKKLLAGMLLAVALVCTGCTNWERSTFQTLSASQSVINQAQIDYEAGVVIPHSKRSFTLITAAKEIQTVAVNEMITYEQLKATGAATSTLATTEAEINTAIAQLPTVITEVRALYNQKAGN